MNTPTPTHPVLDLAESAAGEEDPGAAFDLPAAPRLCPECGGLGKLDDGDCPACGGTGKAVKPTAGPGA